MPHDSGPRTKREGNKEEKKTHVNTFNGLKFFDPPLADGGGDDDGDDEDAGAEQDDDSDNNNVGAGSVAGILAESNKSTSSRAEKAPISDNAKISTCEKRQSDTTSYSAAISTCEKGPDITRYNAASSACEKGQTHVAATNIASGFPMTASGSPMTATTKAVLGILSKAKPGIYRILDGANNHEKAGSREMAARPWKQFRDV